MAYRFRVPHGISPEISRVGLARMWDFPWVKNFAAIHGCYSAISTLADRLQLQNNNISRRFLELIAADHYSQGRIGAAEVHRMLNFSSRWETYQFLKDE